jgi:hypothetical protein
MIDEHNFVPSGRSEGEAYKSSQVAELSLNAAILRVDIARSYEEFLDIFETFYDDDVEVSGEDLREMIRGKARVHHFLLNVLVPLHVMAEVAGLSISVHQTAVPGDSANEARSAWRIDFAGIGGKRPHFEMVRHSEMECVQGCIRAPLRSSADRRTTDHGRLEFEFGSFGGRFRFALLRAKGIPYLA